ncbi:response regulator [bacterium]|nr:response regulator [bacterium]
MGTHIPGKPKILLVDDRQENLDALLHLLEDFEADLLTATSGNRALELILKHEFALILLDVQMPEMDGYETAHMIHSRMDTPIIFITAFGRETRNIQQGYQSGAVDYLVKPIDGNILKSKVSVFLTLCRQKKQLEASNQALHQEIAHRSNVELELTKARESLEARVKDRTAAVETANLELQRSEARMRLVIDNIPAMVAFVDSDRRYQYVNHQYQELVGEDKNLEGESIETGITADLTAKTKPHIDRVLKGLPIQFELEIPDRGQKSRFFSASCIPHMVEDIPHGFFSLIQDITDQKEKDMEKRQLETQQRQIRKLKTIATLTGGVAHEFNNLLVPIIGFSKMVRKTLAPDSTESDYLDRVIKAAYRASHIIAQVRLFSQKVDVVLEKIEMASILPQVFDEVRTNLPKTVALKLEMINQLTPVFGNLKQIRQLVLNLSENAVDAMPEGGKLRVRLFNREGHPLLQLKNDTQETPCVCMVFEDTGHGMNNETREQIFDPFFTTRKDTAHIGLGLSVVMGIVEQMDGVIDVKSIPERGTEFHVILPAYLTQTDTVSNLGKIAAEDGGASVLLVDDEVSILELNRLNLEEAGYHVTTEASGTRALQLFSSNPRQFDIVIADQKIQDISALELAQKIRTIQPDIPIIICTGRVDSENERTCRKMGIDAVLHKPFDFEVLDERIQKVIEDRHLKTN